MIDETHRNLVEGWYQALAEMDVEGFVALHHADCVYNIAGDTIISGRIDGMDALVNEILPLVFGKLKPETVEFSKRYKIVCGQGNRAVGMMEADAEGLNGKRYNQRYCHMFDSRDGKLSEVWEFFDTTLANEVLFADVNEKEYPNISGKFDF